MELLNFAPAEIISAISWTLIHSIWQISLIGLLLFIFKNCVHSQNHNRRYLLAITALFSSCIVSLITFIYYFSSTGFSTNSGLVSTGLDTSPGLIGNETSDYTVLGQAQQILDSNHHMITLLWFFGMLFLLVRFIMGLYQTRLIKSSANIISDQKVNDIFNSLKSKMAIDRLVKIAEHSRIKTAMVVGYWQPIILFPVTMVTALTEDELKAIIAHELGHIKRNDFLVNIFQTLAELVLYYHPIIWWISAVIDEEREICCDDLALKATQNSHAYATALVKLQEYKLNLNLAMAFSGKGNQFKNRIFHILKQPLPQNLNKERSIALMLITFFTLAFTNVALEEKQNNSDSCEIEECVSFCIPKDMLNTPLEISNTEDRYVVVSKSERCASPVSTHDRTGSKTSENKSCTPTVQSNEIKIIQLQNGSEKTLVISLDSMRSERKKGLDLLTSKDSIPTCKKTESFTFDFFDENLQQNFITDSIFKALSFKINGNNILNLDSLISTNNFAFGNDIDVQVFIDSLSSGENSINAFKNQADLFSNGLPYGTRSYSFSNNSLEDQISTELLNDGLLDIGDSYSFELTSSYLKIDGEKQPKTIFKKYKKIYEKRVGFSLHEGSTIVINSNIKTRSKFFKSI